MEEYILISVYSRITIPGVKQADPEGELSVFKVANSTIYHMSQHS